MRRKERTNLEQRWMTYRAYHSPHDPCPPREPKQYVLAPNQFITVQPRNLRQYSPREALAHGVLWPDLYSPYPYDGKGGKTK